MKITRFISGQFFQKGYSSKALHSPVSLLVCVLVIGFFLTVCASPLHAAYVKRYTTIANGGMTYTGNALGLSKASATNAPGTNGSIGTFMASKNPTSQDGSYPIPTTNNWTLNASAAQLRLPAGSTVLYAELIWGGSYNYGGQNVSGSLNNAVTFSGPFGSTSVSPSPSTAFTTGSGEYYYVRSADVTSYVQAGGAGSYTVGGVPGT
ncbi:MAG TPA: hypothetical protein PLV15_00070, partial [Smithella sp.]|nr:hypothetical protein [Smithella sp.]